MNNKILVIFKKELRELFRDKKSLAMMLIIPIMLPIIIFGISALFNYETGSDESAKYNIGITYSLSETEKNLLNEMEIDFKEVTLEEAEEQMNNDGLDAYITKESGKYSIIYSSSSTDSVFGMELAQSFLEGYKSILEQSYLQSHDINTNEFNNLLVYELSDHEEHSFFEGYILNYAFMFVLMAITVSATYPATDATAGEKERGTLETLLSFPIKSRDIIVGKLLSVTTSSIITGMLSLILAFASLIYSKSVFSVYDGIEVFNAKLFITATIIVIAFSILISGLCIAIASMSKSFKEAQSSLSPLTFLAMMPGLLVTMMNIKNSIFYSLIPFLNFNLAFSDVVDNNVNWLYMITMFVATIVFIAIVIKFIIKSYRSEKVLFTN